MSETHRVGRRKILRGLAAAGLAPWLARAAGEGVMNTKPIQSSGEALPVIGLGTWQTLRIEGDAAARAAAADVLRAFVAQGGRLIDSSPMYGPAESAIGTLAGETGIASKLFYATKVWTRGREAGIAQMEESFARMRVRTIDLMQVHNLVDTATHLATLREWKAQGRVRYLGITHYTEGAHDEVAGWLEREPLDFVQINYSLGEPQAGEELLARAAARGVAVIANRPFAKAGLFARVRGKPLPDWARAHGARSWAQLFLQWVVSHPAVTCAIPATSKPEHLLDNMAAGRLPMLEAAARAEIAAAFARL